MRGKWETDGGAVMCYKISEIFIIIQFCVFFFGLLCTFCLFSFIDLVFCAPVHSL